MTGRSEGDNEGRRKRRRGGRREEWLSGSRRKALFEVSVPRRFLCACACVCARSLVCVLIQTALDIREISVGIPG